MCGKSPPSKHIIDFKESHEGKITLSFKSMFIKGRNFFCQTLMLLLFLRTFKRKGKQNPLNKYLIS